jgi:hypothetical protein
MKEDKLLSEIKDLKGTCDRLKVQLQMKKTAGNVSKTEMEKLRVQKAELEGKPSFSKSFFYVFSIFFMFFTSFSRICICLSFWTTSNSSSSFFSF